MKKNTAYTIGSLIVLLICAFCFVILPAFTGSDNREKLPAFGKYDGKEIRYEQGSDFYNYVVQYSQMYQNMGQQIDSSTYYYIFNYAFNSTVTKMAYESAVKKSGYIAPNNAITRKMLPYFSDENGKYSSKLYRETPDTTKIDLRNNIETGLYTSRFYDDNFGSTNDFVGDKALYGIKESSSEFNFLADLSKEKRGFKMAVFSKMDYPEDEIVKFGKENASKFNKFDLSVITFNDASTANNILKRINNNEITFEDALSDENSTKTYSNTEGKLANLYQYQVENILKNVEELSLLENLTLNGLSEIIETGDKFSIFRKDGDTVAPDFEDKDIKNIVHGYIRGYESTIIEDYFTAKATDFTNAAMKSDFDTACSDLSVEKVDVAPFAINYGNVKILPAFNTNNEIKGLTNADLNENFLTKAFSLKMNEISEPIVMNDYVIVLQYTTEENNSEDSKVSDDDLRTFDENSANSHVLSTDKLVNNLNSVYFKYFMSN